MSELDVQGPVCPIPLRHEEQIVLGHGSGGRMSHELIERVFFPAFENPLLRAANDGALLPLDGRNRLVISTDSHVVWPLFFPGGDIGRLAVCGTVNDVAMMGARPLYLSAGFILEEGLEIELLRRVLDSMQRAAKEAGVQIVAGDTKVVQRGHADGLYINTCGIGLLELEEAPGGQRARPGDAIILSGSIGEHGLAVLAARGELGLESTIQSDVAPLNHLVAAMFNVTSEIHVLRDPTRGGLATTLNEIARQSGVCLWIEEEHIPIRPEVRAACELLGFDPLYIANEGKLVAILPKEHAPKVLEAMRQERYGEQATIIGEVHADPKGKVLMRTSFGSTRLVDMLPGEMLPRIC